MVIGTASFVILWASTLRVVMNRIARIAIAIQRPIHQIAPISALISAPAEELASQHTALLAPVALIVSAVPRSACNPTSPIVAMFTGTKVAYRGRALSAIVTQN